MALLRLCSMCKHKIPYGTKCTCEINMKKEKYKLYKHDRTDKKEQKLYSSKEWIGLRNYIRGYYNGLDIWAYYEKNQIIQGNTVHHIIEIKDNWDERLNSNNLILLSDSSHKEIHRLYLKNKIETQKKLFELIKRFRKEFK